MVRVAGLKRRIAAGVAVPTVSGMMPREVLVLNRTRSWSLSRHGCSRRTSGPALAKEGIEILRWDELTSAEKDRMDRLFAERIFPVLTPLAVDPSSLPLHLGLVDQPSRAGPQPGDRHSPVRAGQGADNALPLHLARRGALCRAGGRDRSSS